VLSQELEILLSLAWVEGAGEGALSLRQNAEFEGFPPALVGGPHQEIREDTDPLGADSPDGLHQR
jgi:hypothetical protein